MRRALLAASVAALTAGTGCVALPFAAPPVVLAAGGGPRTSSRDGGDLTYDLRAGVSPFGISGDWVRRRGDLSFGYVYAGGSSARLHEVYVRGGVVAASRRASDGVLRVVPHAELRGLYDPGLGRLGRGASLGVVAELAAPASGPFSSSSTRGGVVGVAVGEGGFGLYADLAVLDLEERFGPKNRRGQDRGYVALAFTAGLTVRVPATAGIVWAFLH